MVAAVAALLPGHVRKIMVPSDHLIMPGKSQLVGELLGTAQ